VGHQGQRNDPAYAWDGLQPGERFAQRGASGDGPFDRMVELLDLVAAAFPGRRSEQPAALERPADNPEAAQRDALNLPAGGGERNATWNIALPGSLPLRLPRVPFTGLLDTVREISWFRVLLPSPSALSHFRDDLDRLRRARSA